MMKRYLNRSMQSFKYEGRRVRALETFETEKPLPPAIAEMVDEAPPEPEPTPPEPSKKIKLTRVAFDPNARTLAALPPEKP